MTAPPLRRGALLIIVTGLMVMLASLVLAFIARTRGEGDETRWMQRRTQAHMMLAAACQYVQETSRIGWDAVLRDGVNVEAFGWVDVRGGMRDRARAATSAEIPATWAIGPRSQLDADDDGVFDRLWRADLVEDGDGDGAPDRPAWPAIGGVCRAPMIAWERPPWAIAPTVAPNAIIQDPAHPAFGLPLLRRRDPEPAFAPGIDAGTADALRWQDWSRGDPAPRATSQAKGWFRVFRDGPATFVVTCGAGATLGFRDWDEVVGLGATAQFFADRALFEELAAQEVRLWYRIEWSAAVGNNPNRSSHYQQRAGSNDRFAPNYATLPSHLGSRPHATSANQGGTIQWIQRLHAPPRPGSGW